MSIAAHTLLLSRTRIAGLATTKDFDSTGIALQDLAAAEMIYARARGGGEVLMLNLNDLAI